MGIFSRLEAFLERLFEAPAGRLGATLQPVLLTKRIERAMDSGKTFGAVGIIVPNRYDLHLHPADFAAFESYRGSLEDDLAHGAATRARRERYHLVARATRPPGRRSGRAARATCEWPRTWSTTPATGSREQTPERSHRRTRWCLRAPGTRRRHPTPRRAPSSWCRPMARRAGPLRPGRAADQHRASQRQRRDRRRPRGEPPSLPAEAAARRLRLRRPRQPQRLVDQRAAGQRGGAGAGRLIQIGSTEIEFQVRG